MAPKPLLVLVLVASLLAACHRSATTTTATTTTSTTTATTSTVTVKYRDSKVDIGSPLFEPLDRQGDSLVRSAWYDHSNLYMVINLRGTNYHYCGFPLSRWQDLRQAESMAVYYEGYIRGDFDCRLGYVPPYD